MVTRVVTGKPAPESGNNGLILVVALPGFGFEHKYAFVTFVISGNENVSMTKGRIFRTKCQ